MDDLSSDSQASAESTIEIDDLSLTKDNPVQKPPGKGATKCESASVRWSKESIDKLVEILSDPDESFIFTKTRSDSKLFDDLAKLLSENGFPRTPKHVKDKLNNLKREYKTVVDKRAGTGNGRLSDKDQATYDQLEPIFGKRGAVRPKTVVQSIKPEDGEAEKSDEHGPIDLADDGEVEQKATRPQQGKKRKTDSLQIAEVLMDSYREMEEKRADADERRELKRAEIEEKRDEKRFRMEQKAAVQLERVRGEQQMQMMQMFMAAMGHTAPGSFAPPRPSGWQPQGQHGTWGGAAAAPSPYAQQPNVGPRFGSPAGQEPHVTPQHSPGFGGNYPHGDTPPAPRSEGRPY